MRRIRTKRLRREAWARQRVKPKPFQPLKFVKYGFVAVIAVVLFRLVKSILSSLSDGGGILDAILGFFGISMQGRDPATKKSEKEQLEAIDNIDVEVLPRHRDYANMLHRYFEESRAFIAFFTEKLSVLRSATVIAYLSHIIESIPGMNIGQLGTGPNTDISEDNPMIPLIDKEFAAIYKAYGLRECADRGIPFVSLFFSGTKGTLQQHLERFLNPPSGVKLEAITNFFAKNRYINH